jgi:hypothetical protein
MQKDWISRRAADKQKLEYLMHMWDKEKNTLRDYYMTN